MLIIQKKKSIRKNIKAVEYKSVTQYCPVRSYTLL